MDWLLSSVAFCLLLGVSSLTTSTDSPIDGNVTAGDLPGAGVPTPGVPGGGIPNPGAPGGGIPNPGAPVVPGFPAAGGGGAGASSTPIISPAKSDKENGTRVYDIMNIFGDLMKKEFNRDIVITVRVYDSQCYDSSTVSSYVIYLASLSFEGLFLDWFPIPSLYGVPRIENGNTYTLYEVTIPEKDFLFDPEECLSMGGDPCVPRADAIFINYHNEIEDRWSIRNIEVEVEFRLWPGHDNWHSYKYHHPILQPCDMWLPAKGIYQIGPRVGLFTKIEKIPLAGQWIRDWV